MHKWIKNVLFEDETSHLRTTKMISNSTILLLKYVTELWSFVIELRSRWWSSVMHSTNMVVPRDESCWTANFTSSRISLANSSRRCCNLRIEWGVSGLPEKYILMILMLENPNIFRNKEKNKNVRIWDRWGCTRRKFLSLQGWKAGRRSRARISSFFLIFSERGLDYT